MVSGFVFSNKILVLLRYRSTKIFLTIFNNGANKSYERKMTILYK